jgi:hypothetical protein
MRRRVARHDHSRETVITPGACRAGGRTEGVALAEPAGRGFNGHCRRRAAVAALASVFVALSAGLCLASGQAVAQTPSDAANQAAQIAQADPRVAAVLNGADYQTETTTWGGGEQPAGSTVVYTWPQRDARSAAGLWPLLDTGSSGVPAPPYDPVDHRLRLESLTSLRVDVLFDGSRVVQIRPLMGETTYVLREETWPPFSWMPWFTARPWVIAPLYIIGALWIIAWAWRRSRAWNRRLPSMTRHDRQFIVRLSVILFLVAGIAWMVYESVVAARSPSVDIGGFSAGDLAALPSLLFPPGLFFAALALEFSPGLHRGAWGLVAILAGCGSVFFLAAATTGAAGNLNLSYYVLLGVLALLTAPRAFSQGRMGWSRHGMPRYA